MHVAMPHNSAILLLAAVCCFGAFVSCKSPPKFSDQYQVGGVLYLPYAEIKEPFMAYYDGHVNRSRISYYGGMMDTYQLASDGEYGISKKLAYESDDSHLNVHKCFQVNGTVNSSVSIQSALPDLTGFEYFGTGKCPTSELSTETCQIWRKIVINWKKKNTYEMWVKPTEDGSVTPVRYNMIGYDSLFGSHYDRYYVTYTDYIPGAIDPEKFAVDGNLTCGGFPGPGLEATHLHNPMNEFINHDNNVVDQAFDDFKTTHGKVYKHETESFNRKNIFRNNFRFIHSKNRQGLTYKLAVNHLADFNEHEMKAMRGKLPTKEYNGGAPFEDKVDLGLMPDTLDWRYYGAVTPVKDQAVCGSCWSFGTTGVLEGAYFLKTGSLVRLSQQQLMDCSWGEGNNACDGGEDFRAYQYMMKNGGLEGEDTYGRYLGADGKCHHNKTKFVVQIKSFVNVTSGDLSALRIAIYKRGPISVAIDAAVKSFSFYSDGVYYDPKCGNKPEDLDHAVLAVGYGVLDGEAYWLVKNSWSTYWGNDGYILISQRNNNCGVGTQPTFPILA